MRYRKYEPEPSIKKPEAPSPLWGVSGLFFIITVPIISYSVAVGLVNSGRINTLFEFPRYLMDRVNLPFVGVVDHLYANLAVAAVISLIVFSILVVIYSFLYRVFGPPKYGKYDSPPIRPGKKPRRSR